ncbi:hypothetical protein PHLGIDRAFT_109917 [Phlebiopsis gigantea 11061_1 CR5-6]|uniref:Aminopeptidase P N-terminal domain-containing protein n=1 Tax=Phlebiopsis gigantea (strain 11061_1 CR5-6) TaxID=745531 RepID=A0A0C3S6K9_PHLG1|nr:hypothetical protein PHLGIDRAFT_109917 [Phlebiopsis gigantea 11061_1 CR5-6]
MYPAQAHAVKTFNKLVELLPDSDRARPQVALLVGEVTPYRNDTDREMSFRQESNFYYMTGCLVPSSYALLTSQPGTSLTIHPSVQLFIPPISPEDVMWSVPPPTLEVAAATHDVTSVKHSTDLAAALDETLRAYPDALVHILPHSSLAGAARPLFPIIPQGFRDVITTVLGNVAAEQKVTDQYLLSALHVARLTKDVYEVAEIRTANEISSRAHETVMRVLGMGVKNLKEGKVVQAAGRPLLPGEWLIEKEGEAEALFVASCRREGSNHQAYLPIVASSTRASTLHYCCNDKAFAWGPVGTKDHLNNGTLVHTHANEDESYGQKNFVPQVLLIDAGCEWNCHASDITRVMPIGNGGKFSPEAGAVYDLVLEMQAESFRILRSGLHWDAVQLLCHRVLVRAFQRLGIFHSPNTSVGPSVPSGPTSMYSEEAILASGISTAFFPHGVGHSLGLDVHDVPSASKPELNTTIKLESIGHVDFYRYLRLRLPLETGMIVTVEPGCYFSPHLLAAVRGSPLINHETLKKYEPVGGVRIEDVVLITENGYENLTTVKSERSWVEGVCSGEL